MNKRWTDRPLSPRDSNLRYVDPIYSSLTHLSLTAAAAAAKRMKKVAPQKSRVTLLERKAAAAEGPTHRTAPPVVPHPPSTSSPAGGQRGTGGPPVRPAVAPPSRNTLRPGPGKRSMSSPHQVRVAGSSSTRTGTAAAVMPPPPHRTGVGAIRRRAVGGVDRNRGEADTATVAQPPSHQRTATIPAVDGAAARRFREQWGREWSVRRYYHDLLGYDVSPRDPRRHDDERGSAVQVEEGVTAADRDAACLGVRNSAEDDDDDGDVILPDAIADSTTDDPSLSALFGDAFPGQYPLPSIGDLVDELVDAMPVAVAHTTRQWIRIALAALMNDWRRLIPCGGHHHDHSPYGDFYALIMTVRRPAKTPSDDDDEEGVAEDVDVNEGAAGSSKRSLLPIEAMPFDFLFSLESGGPLRRWRRWLQVQRHHGAPPPPPLPEPHIDQSTSAPPGAIATTIATTAVSTAVSSPPRPLSEGEHPLSPPAAEATATVVTAMAPPKGPASASYCPALSSSSAGPQPPLFPSSDGAFVAFTCLCALAKHRALSTLGYRLAAEKPHPAMTTRTAGAMPERPGADRDRATTSVAATISIATASASAVARRRVVSFRRRTGGSDIGGVGGCRMAPSAVRGAVGEDTASAPSSSRLARDPKKRPRSADGGGGSTMTPTPHAPPLPAHHQEEVVEDDAESTTTFLQMWLSQRRGGRGGGPPLAAGRGSRVGQRGVAAACRGVNVGALAASCAEASSAAAARRCPRGGARRRPAVASSSGSSSSSSSSSSATSSSSSSASSSASSSSGDGSSDSSASSSASDDENDGTTTTSSDDSQDDSTDSASSTSASTAPNDVAAARNTSTRNKLTRK